MAEKDSRVRFNDSAVKSADDEHDGSSQAPILQLNKERKELLFNFAEHTSAHGFIGIQRTTSKLKRVLWTAAVIVMWIFCVVQIFSVVHKYFQYKTTVSIQVKHSTSVNFPAVTFCNLNAVKATWVNDLNNTMAEFDELASSFNWTEEQWAAYARSKERPPDLNKDDEARYDLLHRVYKQHVNLTEAGHLLEEMLIECTFQSTKCTLDNFTRWEHGTYGNCYTMIVPRSKYPSFIGPMYGLSLVLYVQDYEYMPIGWPTAGFRVEIHPPEYVPFPEDRGFILSPGTVTSAAMKHRRIDRLPLPYDGEDCGTLGDQLAHAPKNVYLSYAEVVNRSPYVDCVNYTAQACIKTCYQMNIYKHCGCLDPMFITRGEAEQFFALRNQTAPAGCEMAYWTGLKCVRNVTKFTTEEGICDKACPESCHEEDYLVKVSAADWPRLSYFHNVKEMWKTNLPSEGTIEDAHKTRANYAKLEVYFEELNYQSIIESPTMPLSELLSSVGGTLGLYAGVSFLTVLEFLELFVRWFAVRERNKDGDCADENNAVKL